MYFCSKPREAALGTRRSQTMEGSYPHLCQAPEATVCARGGKALSAQAPDYSPGQALVVGLALRVTLP